MATVIDALLVTLGLDPSDYKKGEEEAAKATAGTAAKVTTAQKKSNDKRRQLDREQQKRTRELANEEKKRADSTVAGFKNVALQASALFLGADSLKGFISLLGNLNSNEAGLGRLGHNLGINTHELNTWGLAATRIGGKAEDIQGAFANVSKSITDLNVNAQVSPLFLLAQRMGLDIRNVTDKTKFLLDLGDKLRTYGAAHGRDAAFNIATQAGIDATTFNLVTADNARVMLAEAERLNNITEATAAAAARTQDKIEALKQRGEAIVRDAGHVITEPAIDAVNAGISSIQDQAQAVAALVHGNFSDAWNLLRHSAGFGGDELPDANTSRGIKNNNPGNIRAVGNQKRDAKGFRIFGSMYEGAAAMDSQLDRYADKGINTIRKIVETYAPASDGNDTAKYIQSLMQATGRGADEVLGKSDRSSLLQGMQRMETGKSTRASAALAAHAQVVAASPNVPRGGTSVANNTAGNNTTVTVGTVTVNTAATDANGVAAGLAGAVKRQTYTAQANTGQTQ